MLNPFSPDYTGTVSIAATAASASVALPAAHTGQIEISNEGPDTVFVKLASASGPVAAVPNGASAGSYPVLPGQSKNVSVRLVSHVAAICASGKTASVWFTVGQGE